MNRSELVSALASRAGVSNTEADKVLGALQEVVVEQVAGGEKVQITGFLSVERVERAARTGRNPATGAELQIPAGYGVKVTAGSSLKKAVKSG
ncbi:MAG: HU family DNA-binding protein [Actinomycetota bacterium]|nr:HU family DNA-binding protein [Actinomycetota bacterium]